MIEPTESAGRDEFIDGEVLQTMRHYDRLAPDGAALAEQVLEQISGRSPGRRSRMPAGPAAGLAAASVIAILATSYALTLGVDADHESDLGTSATSPSATASSEPAGTNASEAALLDPLIYRLTLAEPQANGDVASMVTVTNRSGDPVTDPNCLHNANYDFGVVPLDQPDSVLEGRVETKCTGPQELPAGLVETFDGPIFSTRGLRAGDYMATIDFGDARSERLAVPLTVP